MAIETPSRLPSRFCGFFCFVTRLGRSLPKRKASCPRETPWGRRRRASQHGHQGFPTGQTLTPRGDGAYEPAPKTGSHGGSGRLAQRESTPFTREGSQVQSLHRPPACAPCASARQASLFPTNRQKAVAELVDLSRVRQAVADHPRSARTAVFMGFASFMNGCWGNRGAC